MRISRTMLRTYVDKVAIGYFAEFSEPPEDASAYADDIDDMLVDARAAGDHEFLRLGLLHVVHDEGEDIERFGGAEIPLHGAGLERLLLEIVERIEPIDAFAPEGPGVPVTLEDMTAEEWATLRG